MNMEAGPAYSHCNKATINNIGYLIITLSYPFDTCTLWKCIESGSVQQCLHVFEAYKCTISKMHL